MTQVIVVNKSTIFLTVISSLERANLLCMTKMIKTIKNNYTNYNTIGWDSYNQNDDTYSAVSLNHFPPKILAMDNT